MASAVQSSSKYHHPLPILPMSLQYVHTICFDNVKRIAQLFSHNKPSIFSTLTLITNMFYEIVCVYSLAWAVGVWEKSLAFTINDNGITRTYIWLLWAHCVYTATVNRRVHTRIAIMEMETPGETIVDSINKWCNDWQCWVQMHRCHFALADGSRSNRTPWNANSIHFGFIYRIDPHPKSYHQFHDINRFPNICLNNLYYCLIQVAWLCK